MALLQRVAEVAAVLDVSPRTVDRLIAGGALATVNVAGTRRVRRVDLEAYVAGLGPRGQVRRKTFDAAARSRTDGAAAGRRVDEHTGEGLVNVPSMPAESLSMSLELKPVGDTGAGSWRAVAFGADVGPRRCDRRRRRPRAAPGPGAGARPTFR